MLSYPSIPKQLLSCIQQPTTTQIKQYIRKLIKQLKIKQDDLLPLLKQTMQGLSNLLKDPNIHPKFKYQSHKLIMFLILMVDLDVYQEFLDTVYNILKSNCMYNKYAPLQIRGQDFFQQSKYYTDHSVTPLQRKQLKQYGINYIIFCLQTVYQLAKWLPTDLDDQTKPTKFLLTYKTLLKQGVTFPKDPNLQFYTNSTIQQLQKIIKQLQKQLQSNVISLTTNSVAQLKIISNQFYNPTQSKKLKTSTNNHRALSCTPTSPNPNLPPPSLQANQQIFLLQDKKTKLQQQLTIQRNYFQNEIQKQKLNYLNSIFQYQQKISLLQSQLSNKLSKNINGNNQSNNKDKIIQQLQINNQFLNDKIKNLQSTIKNNKLSYTNNNPTNNNTNTNTNENQLLSSMSLQLEKLKKQNHSLRVKLLTECSQASQFSSKKSQSSSKHKQQQALKFISSQDARSCFQPFYGNSSSQIKTRLKKAILRQKQLLYRDKVIQIGCITKLQNQKSIHLIIVFTNISQKPLFNFSIDIVSRDDLSIKTLQSTKTYLQITGQTKSQLLITITQIDFRCIVCSLTYTLDTSQQKLGIILPISKFKLIQQLVYTPIKTPQHLKILQKVFQPDHKIIPNLHKLKNYFPHSILQLDKLHHQYYHLKFQFLNIKFYLQCNLIQNQLRLAIKYYSNDHFPIAQKLIDQLVFLFIQS